MNTKSFLALMFIVLLVALLTSSPATGQIIQGNPDGSIAPLQESTPTVPMEFPPRVPAESGGKSPTIDSANSPLAISPVGDPTELALAMGIPQNDLVSATIYTSDPVAFGVSDSPLGFYFPIQGSTFAILSTGMAENADDENSYGNLSYSLSGLNNSQGNDLTQLGLDVKVPAGMNCANIDFVFFSEEFPEFVGSMFNDAFTAELGGTNLTISDNNVIAPLNFAFDALDKPISVNTVSGVVSPTNTTYDGMTAFRRAHTPVVAGETLRIVFSIQDLGDSIYDSAVFLDNFQWTYDLECGSGVVPPPTPQGNLLLHMASAVPLGAPISPSVTVMNQSSGPAEYTVIVQLRQGFGLIDEQTQFFSFLGTGSLQHEFNFGVYDPATYYIRAELYQGGERLETQVQAFSVGLDYLKLMDAANRITDAAIWELNDAEAYASEALTQAALTALNETVDVFIDAFLGVIVSGLSGLGDIAPDDITTAIEDLTGKAQDFAISVELGDYSKIYTHHQGVLDKNTFNGKRSEVETTKTDFLDYAGQKIFTWNSIWQADILHHETEIRNVNETYATGGIAVREDYQPPFVRWASLSDVMNQFNWFKNTVLPAAELVSTILLIVFLIVLVVIAIIMLIPSGGTSSALLIVAAAVGKVIAAVYTTLFVWMLKSQTTKFVLSTVIIMMLAFGVSFAAEVRVAPEIVSRHQSAIQYLRNKVDENTLPLSVTSPQLVADANADGLNVGMTFTDPVETTIAQVELYRADGRLMDIVDFGAVAGSQDLSTYWDLLPGKYWVVGSSTGKSDRQVEYLVLQIVEHPVKVDLAVSENRVDLGDQITATITVTNPESSLVTDLQVALQTLHGDVYKTWSTDLAAGETKTFHYNFVLQQLGTDILRASVGNLENLIDTEDEPVIIGNGPAIGLDLSSAPASIQSGQPIEWSFIARNLGNEAGSIPVTMKVYDESAQLITTATEYVSLSPGQSSTFNLTPITSANPGKYMVNLYLGDLLYSVRNVIVEAEGTLFILLNADPILTSGSLPVSISIEVQDEKYQPVEADMLLTVSAPDGSITPLILQPIGTGQYIGTFMPALNGTYTVEATAHKDHYLGGSNDTYFIVGSPSQLVPLVEDQITLGTAQEVSISVTNNGGTPIPGAKLVISGVEVYVTGETDLAGFANLVVNPTSKDPLSLSVKKDGFADTSTSLPVNVVSDTTAPMLTFSAPSITNQSSIKISGKTEPGATLLVLDELVPINDDGEFTTTVGLVEGNNEISVQAIDPALNTALLVKNVQYDNTPPSIVIVNPPMGLEVIEDAVLINGTSQGTSLILVNGQPLVIQTDGQFSGWVGLEAAGPNEIKVIAYDQAGNVTTQAIMVTKIARLFLPILTH